MKRGIVSRCRSKADLHSYDDNGNRSRASLPGGLHQNIAYDVFNMPNRFAPDPNEAGVATELEYDGTGARVIKRRLQGNPSDGTCSGGNPAACVAEQTLTIGELYEQVTTFGPGCDSAKTFLPSSEPEACNVSKRTHKYRVYAGGRQVAEVSRVDGTPGDTTRYLHSDELGSIVAVSDDTGAPSNTTKRAFSAFGEHQGEPFASTDILSGFTGLEHDEDLTGAGQNDDPLVNMRGRLYDPHLGRFISPDPFVTKPYHPQGLNRYAYVLNNPLSMVDPSGFDPSPSGGDVGPSNAALAAAQAAWTYDPDPQKPPTVASASGAAHLTKAQAGTPSHSGASSGSGTAVVGGERSSGGSSTASDMDSKGYLAALNQQNAEQYQYGGHGQLPSFGYGGPADGHGAHGNNPAAPSGGYNPSTTGQSTDGASGAGEQTWTAGMNGGYSTGSGANRPAVLLPFLPYVATLGGAGSAESTNASLLLLPWANGLGGVGAAGGMFFDFSRLSFGTYLRGDLRGGLGNYAGAGVEGGLGYSEGFEGYAPFVFLDIGGGAKVGGKLSYSASSGPAIGGSIGYGTGVAVGGGPSYTIINHEQSALGAILQTMLNSLPFVFMSGGYQDPGTSRTFVPR